ncbi:MAG: acyl-CoA dehydrogenase family protein [Planctomycetota bacterium]|jgi:alkylation response protein AidB-like acyl-CoA dehydrogenase
MRRTLTADEAAFRDLSRRFANEVIEPNYLRFDRENRFPDTVHDEAHSRGLLNVCVPRELGGSGVSYKAMAEGGLELAKVCPAVAFTLGFNHGALRPILFAGTAEQKQRFVREHIEQHRGYTGLALTEPDVAGSNLIASATRADRIAGGWVIAGTKCMVGMGTVAQQYVVLANTFVNGRRVGLSFFIVPRTESVEVGLNTDKLGFRAVPTPQVTFHDVRLTDEHLLGVVGEAEPILYDTLHFIRYGGGIVILGAIEGALYESVPWLEERKVLGGRRLLQASHVQLALGRAYAELESLKLLLRRVADLLDRGLPVGEESAALKLLASQLAVRAARELVQMHGWRGIDAEYAVQKRFRDAQQTTIFEGTSETLQLKLCAEFLAKVRSAQNVENQVESS